MVVESHSSVPSDSGSSVGTVYAETESASTATASAMVLLSVGTLRLLPAFEPSKRFAFRYILSLVAVGLALGLTAGAGAARRPAIAGTDVLSGKHVALSQFARKPVFVSVWGSWCYGCKTEAPTLARF